MTTMADLITVRQRLMEGWETALETARKTGYWKDVEACGAIVEAFHEEVRHALLSGKFSGDGVGALRSWEEVGSAEADCRQKAEAEARFAAPLAKGSSWWRRRTQLRVPEALPLP